MWEDEKIKMGPIKSLDKGKLMLIPHTTVVPDYMKN